MIELVTCGWCKRSAYPNEMRYSELLDCNVCPDCDADEDRKTHGEIQKNKRERARATAFQNGMGWVK